MPIFDITVVRDLRLRYTTQVEADDADAACLQAEQQAEDIPLDCYDCTDLFVEYSENVFKE